MRWWWFGVATLSTVDCALLHFSASGILARKRFLCVYTLAKDDLENNSIIGECGSETTKLALYPIQMVCMRREYDRRLVESVYSMKLTCK